MGHRATVVPCGPGSDVAHRDMAAALAALAALAAHMGWSATAPWSVKHAVPGL